MPLPTNQQSSSSSAPTAGRSVHRSPARRTERDRIYARQAELVPPFAGYQAATSRLIPVVAIDRAPSDRAAGAGAQLRAIHDGMRSDLAELRARLADGRADAQLPPSLLQHCLAFCGSVSAHHDRESAAFPDLERRFPALGPGLRRIRAEHVAVARLVSELRELLDGEHDRAALRTRVDRVATELEAHFDYEEAQLVPVLDTA
jgi:hypothetical protein